MTRHRLITRIGLCVALFTMTVGCTTAKFLEKNVGQAIPVAALPIAIFALLDAYYLGLERGVRNTYAAFVEAVRSEAHPDAMPNSAAGRVYSYGMVQTETSLSACLRSGSIWVFYLSLLGLLVLVSLVRT